MGNCIQREKKPCYLKENDNEKVYNKNNEKIYDKDDKDVIIIDGINIDFCKTSIDKPCKPDEDINEEYIWIALSVNHSEFQSKQEDEGFVVTVEKNNMKKDINQLMWLRKKKKN